MHWKNLNSLRTGRTIQQSKFPQNFTEFSNSPLSSSPPTHPPELVTEASTSDKLVKSAQIEEVRLAIVDLLSRKPDAAGEIGYRGSSEPQASSDPLTGKLGVRKDGVNTKVTVTESPRCGLSIIFTF